MVGVNDPWTQPIADPPDDADSSAWNLDRIRDRSRLYRLVYMLVQSFRLREQAALERADASGQVEIGDHTFDLGFQRKASEEAQDPTEDMGANLQGDRTAGARRRHDPRTDDLPCGYPKG